ncbi:MAG: hypothetical protein HQK50_02690 [Oligoflexia bacterium]|nr:hypothetical protein [Oligoflexia bacterium]
MNSSSFEKNIAFNNIGDTLDVQGTQCYQDLLDLGIDKRYLFPLEIKILQKFSIYTTPYLFFSPMQIFFIRYCTLLPWIPPGVWAWYNTPREHEVNYTGLIVGIAFFSFAMVKYAATTKKLQQQHKSELEQLRKKYCL